MLKEEFQQSFLPLIPEQPGIYRYYNAEKKLLYVGKAKNLKKRITSYFYKTHADRKLNRLVSLVRNIEWTLTDSEHDAFLLENSLIKHFRPPYNIRLKDDKTYPYLVIKRESFPRVFLTRQKLNDGSEYLGPFTSVGAVHELMRIIKGNIPLRTCSLPLTPGNIRSGKFKPCLEYHIGNCKAPCVGWQTEEEYRANIDYIREVFKGNLGGIVQSLKKQMQEYVAELDFEKAQMIKNKLDQLSYHQAQSTVVNAHLGNLDVASIVLQEDVAYVNFMVVADGRVIHSRNEAITLELGDEAPKDILSHTVALLHGTLQSVSKEVVTHLAIETLDKDMEVTIPKTGYKKKLLELSFKNNEFFIRQVKKKKSLLLQQQTDETLENTLLELQGDLGLTRFPDHIECFDNSNFQGAYPVAAMVCFRDGKPSKNDYRRFHIKTVTGINDFASMAEIVRRRYKKMLEDRQPLPKLVIIDGGKGQLGAAMESITELGLVGRMTVVGLAKREELIFFPGQSEPLRLPFNGKSLLLIRRIRDEVHRFGITFHRETRSKGTIKNELEDIRGIGAKTAQTLLQHFRSVKRVSAATIEELNGIVDTKKAQLIFEYFKNKQDRDSNNI
ncbi:MAG: excinuclease ABC subunit C [Bacteroidetes bacterium 47-18]|nr:MAG: excinuclease ABC subunit C [Bacteroidetes bacterium 47-18]